MSPRTPTPTSFERNLLALALAGGLLLAFVEARALWISGAAAEALRTPSNQAAIGAALLVGLAGWLIIFAEARGRPAAERLFGALRRRVAGWALSAVLIAFVAWLRLWTGWQTVLSGPWIPFMLSAAVAFIVHGACAHQKTRGFGWDVLALTLGLFLFPRIAEELWIIFPEGPLAGAVIPGIAVLLLLLVAALYTRAGESARSLLIDLRGRLGRGRWAAAALALLAPAILRYGIGAGFYLLYPNLRFAFLLAALTVAAWALCTDKSRLVSLESLGWSTGVLVLVSAGVHTLLLVVNDPFSLSWSEGNRLYDYSLVFGQNLYDYSGTIPDPYGTPGRYALWGVLFLWQGLPIWAHRLWNGLLLTVPSIVLAWALTRRLPLAAWRAGLFLWIAAFFMVVALLHPPFMIMALIVALFVFHPSPVVRGLSLLAAGFYGGLSRWTWLLAPGAWGALTDLLLYYPSRKGNLFQRLLPTGLMALAGTLPSLLLNLGNVVGYSSGALSTAQQPLLWYRLLPNPTLGPGILFLILWTTGPLLALLIYKMRSRQWRLDALQLLAVWGALLGFLGAGLVISTKIGGGGDLHNLDMYVTTLVFTVALGLTVELRGPDRGPVPERARTAWPAWAVALVCLLALQTVYPFTPFSPDVGSHAWLDVPSAEESEAALDALRTEVAQATQNGEVLFMDQRQLVTFGYVTHVPFVPEYEKKYMMDQALASNAAYFKLYYRDLAAGRFALIVTEPLKTTLKGGEGGFADENDYWVTWVSIPTLCFYEPILTDRVVGIELLAPRPDPVGCETYLQ